MTNLNELTRVFDEFVQLLLNEILKFEFVDATGVVILVSAIVDDEIVVVVMVVLVVIDDVDVGVTIFMPLLLLSLCMSGTLFDLNNDVKLYDIII